MKVLILLSHYLPGFKAGGPTRSIANLVSQLGDEIEFYVVTRNRDLGDQRAYPNVAGDSWQRVGKARVSYLSMSLRSFSWLGREMRRVAPDVIYLNSFFDWQFCLVPRMLARCGMIPDLPVILAPRGQFGAGAMQLTRWKKRPYLTWFKSLGFQNRVIWHATSEDETKDVARLFGPGAQILMAPNICAVGPSEATSRTAKRPGELRLIFLSRVSRKKNLDRAIDMLRSLPGRVALDVCGPVQDATYQRQCSASIAKLPDHVTVSYRGVIAPDRVASTLAQYDALLLPTRGENFGHVIVEALSAGCPVVISDRTPWRGLQELGVGWDLPLESDEAFGRALATLTAMDERTHQAMRTKAAAFGRTIANCPETVAAYRQLFHAALSNSERTSRMTVRHAA